MKNTDYPALFRTADNASNIAQRQFFRGVVGQYALLFLSAVVALGPSTSVLVLSTYAGLILTSTLVLAFVSITKPEKDWYGCRALAESFKTLTWRFMMNAEPFSPETPLKEVRDIFSQKCRAVLEDNSHVRQAISRYPDDGVQITKLMLDVRELGLKERLSTSAELIAVTVSSGRQGAIEAWGVSGRRGTIAVRHRQLRLTAANCGQLRRDSV